VLNDGQCARIEARTVAEIIADQGGLQQFLSPETTPGIAIPFPAIHETLSGLRASKFILLAARPAVGKSAFAVQVAETAAAAGKRVLVVSLEMSARDLLYRSITGRGNVSAYKFRTGRLSETERFQLHTETSALVDLNDRLRIADKSQATVQRISAMLRSLAARGSKSDLLVVDYLQLLTTMGRVENRTQQVSEISRGLKQIAQQFEIPVLALSQLSRKGTQDGREPQLEDLRDSGQLEQDADQVLFLWLKKEPQQGESLREVSWKVAKNRDGILNRGTLNFYAKYCRFEIPDSNGEDAHAHAA
jgi:replicative DNA helicase